MSRNIRIVPDRPTLLSLGHQTAHTKFDVLILPGGGPGASTFCATPAVLEMISEFRKAEKWVATICAATTALVASQKQFGGSKCRVTSHPSVQKEIEGAGWEYSEERVVVDGKMITSRGPGTAMGFALEIVERLSGEEKSAEVQGPMITAGTL
jgi:protein DJ-1